MPLRKATAVRPSMRSASTGIGQPAVQQAPLSRQR
jgi:hypothetical protein